MTDNDDDETAEILADPEVMKRIAEAQAEVAAGRGMNMEQFLAYLDGIAAGIIPVEGEADALRSRARRLRDKAEPVRAEDEELLDRPAGGAGAHPHIEDRSEWDELLGPFYDVAGLNRYLGVSKQSLADQVKHRRVLALTTSDGMVVYPAFQFDGLDMLAGLPDVLGVFAGVPVDGWTLASWLLAPTDRLEGMSVVGWLRAGRDPAQARVHAADTAARWTPEPGSNQESLPGSLAE